MKGLTENQETVMAGLRMHGGFWHNGCGWVWGTASGTERMMQALEKKGLVTSREWYKQHRLYWIPVPTAPFDYSED